MAQDPRTVAASADAAVLLVVIVLVFITISPWMVLGVPAVLWAIAGIVKAINGSAGGMSPGREEPAAPSRNELPDGPTNQPEPTPVEDRPGTDT